MKTSDRIESNEFVLKQVVILAGIMMLLFVGMANAAQGESKKAGTVTIEVWMLESKSNELRPATGAKVHIEGTEDPQDTNDKGRAVFSEVPIGKGAVKVKIINENLCTIGGVAIAGGDQLIKVRVEKAQKIDCRVL